MLLGPAVVAARAPCCYHDTQNIKSAVEQVTTFSECIVNTYCPVERIHHRVSLILNNISLQAHDSAIPPSFIPSIIIIIKRIAKYYSLFFLGTGGGFFEVFL